jgi:hypothetical protein
MILLKFNEIRFITDVRIFKLFTNINTPEHTQINKILTSVQNTVTSNEMKQQIDICKTLLKRMKSHQSSSSKLFTKLNKVQAINEFGINAGAIAKNMRRDSYNIRQKVKDIVLKYDFEGELALTPKVKTILEGVNDFEFNVLELSKATGGNEMTVLTTYLMAKHNLYVN